MFKPVLMPDGYKWFQFDFGLPYVIDAVITTEGKTVWMRRTKDTLRLGFFEAVAPEGSFFEAIMPEGKWSDWH